MAKRKKKVSQQVLKTINQNGSGPDSPFLTLKKVSSLEDQNVQLPEGATVFTVGGSEVVAFHAPAIDGAREKIFVRGFERYPTWHELASVAQLLPSGTMWAALPEPNMAFMVGIISFDNLVEKGSYDVMVRMLMHVTNENKGELNVPFNDFMKMHLFLEHGGEFSLNDNPVTGNYEARLLYEEGDEEKG